MRISTLSDAEILFFAGGREVVARDLPLRDAHLTGRISGNETRNSRENQRLKLLNAKKVRSWNGMGVKGSQDGSVFSFFFDYPRFQNSAGKRFAPTNFVK